MTMRHAVGELPKLPHTALRSEEGALRFEHCLTTRGFDGPYSILYHLGPPHLQEPSGEAPIDRRPRFVDDPALLKRHFRTSPIETSENDAVVLLANEDVEIGFWATSTSDATYRLDGDHDRLLFVLSGTGTLVSWFGELRFGQGDYVVVPRGVLHRFAFDGPTRMLRLGFAHALDVLRRFRNEVGQLRMDAPLGHRDFRLPELVGPRDEGIRALAVRRGGFDHGFLLRESPLDVVGWDGAVFPYALPIRAFRPRVGLVHLPPDTHGTFEAQGALVSSFVPRPLDFAEGAIPCPYPHSSVDCDEVIFYASGDFLSRRGIEPGSVTLHPAGLPHGPIVEAYEASIGRTRVDEVAVMLDVSRPLRRTIASELCEDTGYHASYLAGPPKERRDG